MNLLIFTQKVDLNDTVLSFFHRWIIELAKHFNQVTVICLYKGKSELPSNIRVFSLGKESGESRLKYLINFLRYIIRLRRDYDVVFAHQNQEYPILGGIIWKLLGKRVYMWRNHYAGSLLTDVAALFCDKVFCTSRYSYTAKYKKTVFMPVGIDTEMFKQDSSVKRVPNSVLSIGRISPSKKLEQFIEALDTVKKNGFDFTASIVGDALPEHESYYKSLKDKVNKLDLNSRIVFVAGVPNDKTPEVYSAHNIFVNLSKSGMLDKTIFEAMACGSIAISCNKDLIGKIDTEYSFREDDVDDLAAKISGVLGLEPEELKVRGEKLRKFVVENHSLATLASKLKEEMS